MQSLSQLSRDLRHVGRLIRAAPGFAGAVVGTLALGIGANTAIVSVVKAVLVSPLSYADTDRLAHIVQRSRDPGRTTPAQMAALDASQLAEFRRTTETLSHVVVYGLATLTLTGQGEPVRLDGAHVSPEAFEMFGVGALVGRTLTARDAGNEAIVLLSESLWRRRFNSDPQIAGRIVNLDGRPFLVAGVMPARFTFPDSGTQFWLSHRGTSTVAGMRPPRFPIIVRLRDEVSLPAAQAEVNMLLRGMGADRGTLPPPGSGRPQESTSSSATPLPASSGDGAMPFQLEGVTDRLVRPVRPAVAMLSVAVEFVLLIACVNAANLLLARTARRSREIATRLAIGASRAQVIRQFITESVSLALIAAVLGLGLAHGLLRVLRRLAVTLSRNDFAVPVAVPNLSNAGLDAIVLVITTLVAIVTGVLFGIVPALHAATLRPIDAVREGVSTGGRRRHAVQSTLVVLQVATATLLCIGAGLLTRSFVSLAYIHPGYDTSNVLTFQVGLSMGGRLHPVAEALTDRLRSTPGVEAVGYTRQLPMTRSRSLIPLRTSPELPAEPAPPPAPPGTVNPPQWPDTRHVSQDYVKTLRVRMVEGRGFDEGDRAGGQQVLLINESLAKSGLLGPDPVGRYVYALGLAPWEVVGIVTDIKQSGLDHEPGPQVFIDLRQLPGAASLTGTMDFVVRTRDGMNLVPKVRRLLAEIAPTATLDNVTPLDAVVSDSIARPQLYASLMGFFAMTAIALAGLGIYSVMSLVVTERTGEIGIRMALGAGRAEVMTLIASRGGALIGAGITFGLVGAIGASRALRSLLVGVGALDGFVYGSVVLVMALCGTAACVIPVIRATRIEPLRAIRGA
jgi:putative ABC transport system permease protein